MRPAYVSAFKLFPDALSVLVKFHFLLKKKKILARSFSKAIVPLSWEFVIQFKSFAESASFYLQKAAHGSSCIQVSPFWALRLFYCGPNMVLMAG